MSSDIRFLEARAVCFAYAGRDAVADVSIAVAPGDMLALAGPNGSGKTTLLRTLSGVLRPRDGTVHLDGVRMSDLTPRARARKIAYVSQYVDQRLAFSVRSLVEMGRAPYVGILGGLTFRDRRIVEEVLASCDLQDKADHHFGELSGGEQQRAMVAMALAQEPEYLLLDEPTVHLDLGHQYTLLELLSRLTKERDIGVAAVLHDLNLALLYFDRLALIHEGRLIASGAPSDLALQPAHLDIFGAPLALVRHPQTGVPQILMERSDT